MNTNIRLEKCGQNIIHTYVNCQRDMSSSQFSMLHFSKVLPREIIFANYIILYKRARRQRRCYTSVLKSRFALTNNALSNVPFGVYELFSDQFCVTDVFDFSIHFRYVHLIIGTAKIDASKETPSTNYCLPVTVIYYIIANGFVINNAIFHFRVYYDINIV